VSALVAAHGGKVELDTAPGEGAVFRVLLPMASQP
jgi:two-component system OmpR family sensor kinase